MWPEKTSLEKSKIVSGDLHPPTTRANAPSGAERTGENQPPNSAQHLGRGQELPHRARRHAPLAADHPRPRICECLAHVSRWCGIVGVWAASFVVRLDTGATS